MISNNRITSYAYFLLICLLSIACTEDENKIYLDSNWKETTKENAAFYRYLVKKEDSLWFLKDYYITGEKQFEGHTKDSLATIFEGDATWYFKTGKVESKIRYKNGEPIGFYAVLEGSIGSQQVGWDEKDLYYYDPTKVEDAHQGSSTSTYEHYYANISKIASRHTSIVGSEDEFSFTLFFNIAGDTIARLNYNRTSDKWEGKEVVFYEKEKRGRNEMHSIKAINTYNEGVIIHTQQYNIREKLMTACSLKDGQPFTGTFYKENCRFQKIQTYKNGSLLKEVTYNSEDEKVGELAYKNDKANEGVLYNCSSLQTYENGKLQGLSIQYLDSETEKIASEYIYRNGLKEGNYYIYEDDSLLLETGSYKNGMLNGELIYYNNSNEDSGSDEQNPNAYYLKMDVKIRNQKPYITEFSQFKIDDNALIQTFELESNNTDDFVYLDNGYHAIYVEDFNSDGWNDLRIEYDQRLYDFTSNTYYVFNSETNKYQHLDELDNIDDIEINAPDKTIKITNYRDEYGYNIQYITYEFIKNELVEKLVIEEVYHEAIDSILVTQIFPIKEEQYPLLAKNLPPIKFVQKEKEQQVIDFNQEIVLKKEPFTIRFPGLINTSPIFGFKAKITASYNKDVFDKAMAGQKEKETELLGRYYSFAVGMGINHPLLIVDDSGHNIFYYDNSAEDNLELVKNINEKVKLFQLTIDKFQDGTAEKTITEIDRPIYMIIYMDKNGNLKIEENEIHYVTLLFEA